VKGPDAGEGGGPGAGVEGTRQFVSAGPSLRCTDATHSVSEFIIRAFTCSGKSGGGGGGGDSGRCGKEEGGGQ
jgi:hypothetical protein